MWGREEDKFVSAGAVEVDETYVGGQERNKHADKKLNAGRGPVGKTAVAGVRDRTTGRINTEVVEHTDKETLQDFVIRHTTPGATVYTDEARAYGACLTAGTKRSSTAPTSTSAGWRTRMALKAIGRCSTGP